VLSKLPLLLFHAPHHTPHNTAGRAGHRPKVGRGTLNRPLSAVAPVWLWATPLFVPLFQLRFNSAITSASRLYSSRISSNSPTEMLLASAICCRNEGVKNGEPLSRSAGGIASTTANIRRRSLSRVPSLVSISRARRTKSCRNFSRVYACPTDYVPFQIRITIVIACHYTRRNRISKANFLAISLNESIVIQMLCWEKYPEISQNPLMCPIFSAARAGKS
jgi:hypothetical protein